jgi:HD superfamily phosphohydrolase
VEKLFERIINLKKSGENLDNLFFDEFLYNFLFNDSKKIDDFICLDDALLFQHFKLWQKKANDIVIRTLSDAIINRKPFKLIKESENEAIFTREQYRDIDKILGDELKDFYYFEDSYLNIGYKDPYLLGKKYPESAEHIWIKIEDGTLELSEKSLIISSLRNKEFKKYRAYIYRDYLDQMEELLC